MRTITKRSVASVEIHNGLLELLNRITLDCHLDDIIYECIKYLLNNQSSEDDWEKVTARFNWHDLDCVFIVNILVMIQDNPYAHILVHKIIIFNKLTTIDHFREICVRARGKNLHSISIIAQKMSSNGRWFGDDNWEKLAIEYISDSLQWLQTNALVALQDVVDAHNWKDLDPTLLRMIGLMAFDSENGAVLLKEIIPLKVLHLEDFDKHAEKITDPHIKWEAYIAVWHAAIAFDRKEYGKYISDKILPPQKEPPPVKKRKYFAPAWWVHIMKSGNFLHF
jgi:hypothetical protein